MAKGTERRYRIHPARQQFPYILIKSTYNGNGKISKYVPSTNFPIDNDWNCFVLCHILLYNKSKYLNVSYDFLENEIEKFCKIMSIFYFCGGIEIREWTAFHELLHNK